MRILAIHQIIGIDVSKQAIQYMKALIVAKIILITVLYVRMH